MGCFGLPNLLSLKSQISTALQMTQPQGCAFHITAGARMHQLTAHLKLVSESLTVKPNLHCTVHGFRYTAHTMTQKKLKLR